MLFNEDVFSGTGVTDVFFVELLECRPAGKPQRTQNRHKIQQQQNMNLPRGGLETSTHAI